MPNLNYAFQWWINTCNAPMIAYDQAYRNQGQRYFPGYSGLYTCYDCSSFVWYGLWYAGFNPPPRNPDFPWNTDGQETGLPQCGFTKYNIGAFVPLPGDIVLRPRRLGRGHTEVVIEQGSDNMHARTMGAHDHFSDIDRDVSINSGESYLGQYTFIYRLGAGGAVGYGSSLYVVAALCGNAWRESTLNPGLHEIGGSGFGLFQWTGSRHTDLVNWMHANGYQDENDPNGQIAYLIHENFWSANAESRANNINSLQDFLQSPITDVILLTRLFCDCWEIPGVVAMQERYQAAQNCYDYINLHAQDGAITEWFIESGYLTPDSKRYNNAVMLYRALAAGGGGGYPNGNPPWQKNNMPVWMMTKKKILIL